MYKTYKQEGEEEELKKLSAHLQASDGAQIKICSFQFSCLDHALRNSLDQ